MKTPREWLNKLSDEMCHGKSTKDVYHAGGVLAKRHCAGCLLEAIAEIQADAKADSKVEVLRKKALAIVDESFKYLLRHDENTNRIWKDIALKLGRLS